MARRIRSRCPPAARAADEIRVHQDDKPVMDDAPYRTFDTMEDYRRWCEENLPDWLGYGRL